MILWHDTEDAPRNPALVRAGQPVELWIGTYPIELGQEVFVRWEVVNRASGKKGSTLQAQWQHNDERRGNSYWRAVLPPLDEGEEVHYAIQGAGASGPVEEQTYQFDVAPLVDQIQATEQEQATAM